MKQIVSAVTSKGQVTLPIEVRRCLGVGTRDKVTFVIEDDGSVRVQASRFPNVASIRGIAGTLPTPMSWEEIMEIAREDQVASLVERKL